MRVTCSRDEAESWGEPREFTGNVKDPNWTWYATGHSHEIHCEDHRASWHVGGVAQTGTNESSVVEDHRRRALSQLPYPRGRPRPRKCVGP